MHDSQAQGTAGWPTAGGGRVGGPAVWADGWYPDPLRRAPLRLWGSGAWTAWLSDGQRVWSDPRPVRRGLGLLDLAALRFVEEVYLPELRSGVTLDAEQEEAARRVLAELTAEATGTVTPGAAPNTAAPAASTAATPAAAAGATPARAAGQGASSTASARPTPAPAPASPAAGVGAQLPGAAGGGPALPRVAAARPPSAFAQWWHRVREAVGSSLALHGLAYLGVLLMFVGVFGLVAFAFGDVRPAVRPLAELVCAAVPFVAAWWLIGHGAVVVGRALEVVGGLLLPILLITSTLDGFPVPPDPHGAALVVVLTALCLLSATAGLLWSRRHPDSGVRFTVAPTLWLAAAMLTLGVGRPLPTGDGVAVPSAAQTAAMTVALVVTTVAAWRRPTAVWAAPAATAALPGTVVVAVLVVLTGVADGWPTVPVAVAGAMLVLQVELLRPRLSAAVADVLAPLTLGFVGLALLPGLAPAAVGSLLLVGFVLLTELGARRGASVVALAVPAAGVVAALLLTVGGSWWGVVAPAAAGVWVVLRRTRPFAAAGPLAAPVLDGAAAVLPVWTVVALVSVTRPAVGLLAAAALVALATVPARTGALRRDPSDVYWSRWWFGGLAVVGAGALAVHGAAGADLDRWIAVAVLVVVAALAVVGPMPAPATVWSCSGALSGAWLLATATVLAEAVPWAARVGVLGVAGLLLVVASHVVSPVAAPPPAGAPGGARSALALHLGLAGHTIAALAVAAALVRQDAGTSQQAALTALALTTGAATLAVLVTAVRSDRDRSTVGAWCARGGTGAALLPWSLAVVGLPLTGVLVLRILHVLSGSSPWWVLVPAGVAVVYASAVRWWGSPRLRTVALWASSVAALVAVLTAGVVMVDDRAGAWPAVLGWTAVLVVGVLQPAARRTALARWSAWLALAPLVGLLVRAVAADLDDTVLVAATAVVVGGSLALVAAVRGVRSALVNLLLTSRPAGASGSPVATEPAPAEPAAGRGRPWTLVPFAVGALELVVGTAVAVLAVPAPAGAVLTLVSAVVLLALAGVLRLGSLGGAAVVLGWSATVWLAGPALQGRAWVLLASTAGVLAAAEVLHRRTRSRGTWTRWDVPVLLAALPVAVCTVALGVAEQPVLTLVGTGALAVAVAAALRWRGRPVTAEVLGAVGTLLVLVGAATAGPGWFALALLALAATHTALAARAGAAARAVRLTIGVLAAWLAWGAALLWLDMPGTQAWDLTALLGAAVPLGFAVHARVRPAHPARSWAFAWGGAGVVVVGLLSAVAVLPAAGDDQPRVAQVTAALLVAVGLVAVAAGLGATPWRLSGLRELCGAEGLLGVLLLLVLVGAGPAQTVGVLAGVAAVLAAAATVLATRAPGHAWFRATASTGAAASTVGLVVGLLSGDVLLLGPVLAAGAVQAGAAGATLRSWRLQALAPVLACLAWWSFAAGALDVGASAYTIAVGVATLAVVELWRADLRRRDESGALRDVVPLELVGVGFLVVVPCVQAVTTSVLQAAVVLLLGVLVAGWGALTRVRRRVVTGTLVVLVSVVLLVGVPLVALLPGWGGAAVWLLVAGAGFVAVLAATQLERGRTALRSTWHRWGQDSSGWE
ncbi:hypothetical protein ACTHAM_002841 [Cellulomonas soli]|uniref:hypothetical protein n=1 Tax=Cellulomonas soli TaxID=931535 RepID=UPI003F84D8A4